MGIETYISILTLLGGYYVLIKKLLDSPSNSGLKSAINQLLLGLSNKLELAHAYGQPTSVQIESTTYCNAKCSMCGRTMVYTGKNPKKPKHMSFQKFKKIMLKLPYCKYIDLQGLGEPLLNPDLISIIKFCKERKS